MQDILTEEQLKIAEWAAITMQKNWRAFKARKEHNKSGSFKERFGEKDLDPF